MFVSLGCRKIVRRAAPKGLKKSDVVWALEKVVLSAVPYRPPPRFPPAASPRQVPPDLPPNTRLAACGGSPPSPHCLCRYRLDRLELAWEIPRKGTQVGKYQLKYLTHYSFLFYTPYLTFIIVLCNTHYYRIHTTFLYTLPTSYPTLLFICFLLLF
jgi:hypothetical protein